MYVLVERRGGCGLVEVWVDVRRRDALDLSVSVLFIILSLCVKFEPDLSCRTLRHAANEVKKITVAQIIRYLNFIEKLNTID